VPDRVGPDGSRSAKIVIIGEAPGRWEMTYGRPFVGPSYSDRLLPWWRDVGLARDAFYIDNVLDYQPAWIDRVPESEMHMAMAALHERLAQLEDPWLIVPTGNYALYALTGKGRVSFHARDGKWARPGITEWRGSVLEYEDRRGRRIKVIPTIHPAASFRTPGYEWVCRQDWRRIAGDLAFRELRLPERTHLIMPSKAEVIEWLRWTRRCAENRDATGRRLACSLDVETPKKVEYATKEGVSKSEAPGTKCRMCGHTRRWHLMTVGDAASPCEGMRRKGCSFGCQEFLAPLLKPKRVKVSEEPYLDCIGYSWDPKLSLTVPTTLAYWQDPEVWAAVKAELVTFHADPNIDFGGQNQSFDAFWCATEGMPYRIAWDLMKMHRVQRPFSEWHDLAFQASLDTREPYWKDEAKDPDSVQRYAGNREAFYTYNGKDNTAQRELLDRRLEALRAAGRYEYYAELEAPMDAPLVELSLHGLRVDNEGRAREYEKKRAEAASVANEIEAAAGSRLVAKTAVSAARMKAFLYDELRLPVQYAKNAKKEKVVSTDIVAIKRLMERFPGLEKLQVVGRLVLQHRRLTKLAGFLKENHVDPDGRWRALFKQDTLLGRLSSAETPRGTGANLQNVDRELKKFFVADTGDEPCLG